MRLVKIETKNRKNSDTQNLEITKSQNRLMCQESRKKNTTLLEESVCGCAAPKERKSQRTKGNRTNRIQQTKNHFEKLSEKESPGWIALGEWRRWVRLWELNSHPCLCIAIAGTRNAQRAKQTTPISYEYTTVNTESKPHVQKRPTAHKQRIGKHDTHTHTHTRWTEEGGERGGE